MNAQGRHLALGCRLSFGKRCWKFIIQQGHPWKLRSIGDDALLVSPLPGPTDMNALRIANGKLVRYDDGSWVRPSSSVCVLRFQNDRMGTERALSDLMI